MNKKILRLLGKIFLIFLISIFLFLLYIRLFEVPGDEQLKNPDIKESSKIFDIKGRLIGDYELENRININPKDVNPIIKDAVIAVEDVRFYEHSGIDFKALLRVLTKTILMQKKESGGGSTITQQLAKQLYKRPNLTKRNLIIKNFLLLKSKLKEWMIAYKIENLYSKEDILTMYLNKFEFINGAHGIEAAAQTYFGKSQKDLSLLEAATLVGMLKNPSLYNPVRFPNKTLERRNVVLKLMNGEKYKIDTLLNKPLDLTNYQRKKYIEGPLPYFRNELAKWLTQAFKENNIKKTDGNYYDIYSDGLTIETTIDLDIQKYAEQASNEHMQWLQDWYLKMYRKIDPWTYKADEKQKLYRMHSLKQRIKASLRYQILKKKFINPILPKINTEINLTDELIEYLSNDPYIKSTISKEKEAKYLKIKESNDYKKYIEPAITSLNDAAEKEFNTVVKMRVFDLKNGEKETTMSPLDSVKYHVRHLQNAVIILDPKSGEVRSWVGGLDYNYFKFDHVNARRSVGSTMKPFLYIVAMMKGIKPCTSYKDQEYSIAPGESSFKNKELWTPNNATNVYTTLMYNLYHGLLYSKNSITVKLLKEVGSVDPLRDLLDKVGLDKDEKLPSGRLAIPELPSIALGAIDISLLQLTGAYATFANGGEYRQPVFIKSVKDKNGKIIFKPKQKITKAIDPLYNAIMVDMLKNVVGGEFTMGLKSENGGKTGTTDDQADGLFVGFTPSLVGGIWTGGDDKWIRFDRTDIGQGYYTARPVFEKLMKKLEADKSGLYDYTKKFPEPPNGFKELTNCPKIKTEPLPEFLRPKLNLSIMEKDTTKGQTMPDSIRKKIKISLFQ